ncbi:von Willebrand factor A domain-containing protein 5B2 [Sciurus carolinensis]|uniref:von Willebrand factor A domain-containing protein 5B2 n=1 Tax=Sciurus carolinensis TaxID=30640 RepID=A0AA41T2R5_SCICA|nr:von Willebrand factor A domain-containing protein 5B2 [Sciurus carolinensis]
MPGLYCPSSWTPLPLTDSWVRACANGPCLSLRARLTYRNPQPQPVDGVFVYPLAEAEVVSGFEAEAAGRRVSFQLQSRRRSQAACCRALGPGLGTSTPRRCAQGHLVLDLAQALSTLVLPTGLIAAAGTMTVTLCSSRELPSRPDGVLHVALPTVLTPLAPPGPPGPPRPPGLCDDSPTSCFGAGSPEEEGLAWEEPPAPPDVFSGPARCPAPYTFSFEMLVTGPCLLAGLESPSHALRADAPPHASSAATICVTLAEGHPCDRPLEILLYPSEPHQPHLMLEAGSLSASEYEARMRARRDFQRLQRRNSDGDRQDAIVLAVKSLPTQTLVNLAMFGTSVQPLFPESRSCSDDTVQLICESIETLQAGSGPSDILAALDWALGQPQQKAHPRQLFLLTAVSPMAVTTHQTLELMRWHRGAARCFSFALGPDCCQLLQGLSALSRGQAYFLRPGERLQPMLVQALRKALEPALSDISVDWFVPDAVEALLTPREIPALYPGDQLLGYCSLFRVDGFRPHPPVGQEPGWHSLGGSVFPSPEEAPSVASPGTEPTGTSEPLETGTVSAELSSPWAAGDSEQSTDALTDPVTDPGPNPSNDTAIWRRIFQSSYIREQYVLTHCSASPEPGPGSTGSSESPGSQGPGSPEGCFPLDPPSQQGCRSLAWGEPIGSRSCPLPAPPQSPFKAGQTQSLADPGNPLWVQYQIGKALSQANSWGRAWMTQPSSRLSLGRRRRLCSSKAGQANEGNSEGSDHDYLPLVRLQEAPGSFRLDAPFCAAVHIPQERLCRASPFAVHRASLSPTSASSPWALLGPGVGQGDSATASCSASPSSGSEGPGQVDSGRGSDTEASEGAEGLGGSDLRGRTWATAVALAWLEHRCAAAFSEWELTAAKADCWLRAQNLPDGLDLAALKAAARGLFLLLRHWDQNLQLHLLCYSPANV